MYCPRCSQQQPSEEVRFCTRCGMPLEGVARLLEGGAEASGVEEARPPRRLTKRQREMRESVVAMIAGVLLTVIAALLTAYKEDFFILLPITAVVFVGGLCRLIYVALVEEDAPAESDAKTLTAERARRTAALGASRGGELPPARVARVSEFVPARADTSEMAAPASVTEGTTRLLEDETR